MVNEPPVFESLKLCCIETEKSEKKNALRFLCLNMCVLDCNTKLDHAELMSLSIFHSILISEHHTNYETSCKKNAFYCNLSGIYIDWPRFLWGCHYHVLTKILRQTPLIFNQPSCFRVLVSIPIIKYSLVC